MFDVIKIESDKTSTQYQLVCNGRILEEEQASIFSYKMSNPAKENFRSGMSASIYDSELFEEVTAMQVKDIFSKFDSISITYPYFFTDDFDSFYIEQIKLITDPTGGKLIKFNFRFSIEKWKQLWSMSEQAKMFKAVLDKQNVQGAKWTNDLFDDVDEDDEQEILVNGYAISFPLEDENSSVDSKLEHYLPIIDSSHLQTLNELSSQARINAIVTYFDFPEEVKNVCEQYLLYFVQFLQDIGIDTTAEIKEDEAGRVLFAVTPKDKSQALSHIRTALDIYLNLPNNTSISPTSFESSIDVQRLVANIYHLKSQLALAGAIVQQKEQLIQQQQTFIQQQLHSGAVLIQSLQSTSQPNKKVSDSEDDKEKLVGDIVSVKKYNWAFVEVDLPTLLRRLKEVFGRSKPKQLT